MGSLTARVRPCLAISARPVLPSAYLHGVGTPKSPRLTPRSWYFAAQYPARTHPADASPSSFAERRRTARSQCDSLLLHCWTFSSFQLAGLTGARREHVPSAHTTSGLRAGKTIAPLSLLAVLLALGCGNSGRNAVGTGGSHSGGATTAAGGVASSAGAGRESRGNHGHRRLPATGGVSSNAEFQYWRRARNRGRCYDRRSPASGGAASAAARRRPVALRPDPWRGFHHGWRWRNRYPCRWLLGGRRIHEHGGKSAGGTTTGGIAARWWAAARLAAPAVLPLGAAARPARGRTVFADLSDAAPPTPIPFAILASPSRIA